MFKNEYTLNKNLITEYVYNIVCKKMIIYGIILIIFSLIMFFLGIESKLQLICICFVLVCIGFVPIIMIKNIERNSKNINNGKIEKTIIDINKNIIMNEGKVHIEFEYTQITKILQTKNFIVLCIGKQNAILLLKDGFVKENKADFLNFINEKIKKDKKR